MIIYNVYNIYIFHIILINYIFYSYFIINFCFYVSGRKIAIDASMCLYQFLIAVRSEGAQLTTVDGETTRYIS